MSASARILLHTTKIEFEKIKITAQDPAIFRSMV